MPTMSNSLIANGGNFGATDSSYIPNLIDTGQLGFGPVLPSLDASTPPVLRPLQLIVTHVPGFLQYIPNGPEYFKALYETHMVSMEGLDFNYTMETDGTPIGRDGQQFMAPTRHTRSQPSPTAMFAEKPGNFVFNLHKLWMNMIHDVDTQASSMAGVVPVGTTLPPMVASMYTADFLMIQYDSTMRPENIFDAFQLTNVFPTDIGSPGYQLNVTQAHRPDRSINLSCIVQHNRNSVAVAKSVATLLNLHQINYQDALPLAQSIEDSISGDGMMKQVVDVLDAFQNLDGQISS